MTRACPVYGAIAFITARSSGDRFSTSDTSRASARGSPARARSISVPGSPAAVRRRAVAAGPAPSADDSVTGGAVTGDSATGGRHPQQQRVALAAATAQRGHAQAAAAPAELVDQVQRQPCA